MPRIYIALAIVVGLVCYGGLIWFVCRLLATNGLEDDEQ